jgi:hypothetical protein
MFEFIAEILAWLPSDVEFGTMRTWFYTWLQTHMVAASALSTVIGYIVYKTKTKKDDQVWAWIKEKIGLGGKVDA